MNDKTQLLFVLPDPRDAVLSKIVDLKQPEILGPVSLAPRAVGKWVDILPVILGKLSFSLILN